MHSNKNQDPHADAVLIRTIGSTISKIAFCICFAVSVGIIVSNCNVDSEIIIQCEDSCGKYNGVKEVTSSSCKCNVTNIETNEWVLPKK
jgi:hypothetical protein